MHEQLVSLSAKVHRRELIVNAGKEIATKWVKGGWKRMNGAGGELSPKLVVVRHKMITAIIYTGT